MKAELHHEISMPSKFNKELWVWALAGVLVAIFAVGTITSLTQGYHHVWGTSNEVPWGLLITAYVYFAVGCTGLCLISSLGHVFHIKAFESLGIRPFILATASMITAFIVLAIELEYVLNLAIWVVLSPNIKSVFVIMGVLYGIYLVCLIMELVFYAFNSHKWSRIFAIFAIITGVSASSNLGLVFGGQVSREFWTAPLVPIMFISSALVFGAAALIILFYFVDRESSKKNENFIVSKLTKLFAIFIAVFFALTAFNIFGALSSSSLERQAAANFLLSGDYSINFWVFEVGLLLIPLVVALFLGKKQLLVMLSSIVALFGLMFARSNLVTAGQIVSLTPDGKGPINILSYLPSWVEITIVTGAFGVIIVGYIILEIIVNFAKSKLSK